LTRMRMDIWFLKNKTGARSFDSSPNEKRPLDEEKPKNAVTQFKNARVVLRCGRPNGDDYQKEFDRCTDPPRASWVQYPIPRNRLSPGTRLLNRALPPRCLTPGSACSDRG
jgi:hypothetical protein